MAPSPGVLTPVPVCGAEIRAVHSVQRYIQRGASPADTFELRKFLEDVRTLGFQIVGAQVPAWNESDVQLASATTPAGVRAVCTAADVVLFCPETAGKKATIAVVECKTGSVGPGLDRPLSGRSLYATPVGPFAHEAGKPGPERTPITRALLHDIQAAATAQLLQQTYGFLDQFNVEIYVVYVDRLGLRCPPPRPQAPAQAGANRLEMQCEWRPVHTKVRAAARR